LQIQINSVLFLHIQHTFRAFQILIFSVEVFVLYRMLALLFSCIINFTTLEREFFKSLLSKNVLFEVGQYIPN
jgi:hypothetical protein